MGKRANFVLESNRLSTWAFQTRQLVSAVKRLSDIRLFDEHFRQWICSFQKRFTLFSELVVLVENRILDAGMRTIKDTFGEQDLNKQRDCFFFFWFGEEEVRGAQWEQSGRAVIKGWVLLSINTLPCWWMSMGSSADIQFNRGQLELDIAPNSGSDKCYNWHPLWTQTRC